jgi:uncharacterized protein YaiI (UPF0178 family)
MASTADKKEPTIWVDADGCPVVIKEILFKAAKRTGVRLVLVANHPMRIPSLANISFQQVASGFDVADNAIVAQCQADDLVISNDVPLAADAVEKGATVLTPRGEILDQSNVRARLNVRDFMAELRDSGVETGGPKSMNQKDRQAFGNALDRWLQRSMR